MMYIRKFRVWVALGLLLGFVSLGYSGQDAKTLYENALRLSNSLKTSDSKQADLKEWKKTVNAYRLVYYTYPSSVYCDNALFQVASLYADMGSRFDDSMYLRRACSTYQFLIEQYGSSPLVEDAMLNYIAISRNQLLEEEDAKDMEAQFRKRFPNEIAKLAPPSAPVEGSKTAILSNLRYYSGTDYSRIVLDFDQEVSFKRNRLSDPDRLYFDFDNTTASKSLIQKATSIDDVFLKQARVGQNTERRARVVLDLKSIDHYDVFALYHPYRLVIDVQGKKAGIPPPLPAQSEPTATTTP